MPTQGMFVRLSQVNSARLIINRIIKDYYLRLEDPTRLPKIFGMTASPVDARVDVVKAAK